MTESPLRDGSPRIAPSVPAATNLTSFSFATVPRLISAAQMLKAEGIEVLVAPRRVAGCGVVLLLDSAQVPTALELLARHSIKPETVAGYLPAGGGDEC